MKKLYTLLFALFLLNNANAQWTLYNLNLTYGLISVHFPDANIGYTVSSYGNVYKTTNNGINWSKQSYCMEGPLCLYFTSTNIGYVVGAYGYIAKTSDGGSNWVKMKIDPQSSTLRSIYFTDINSGYVVGDGGKIFKTTDGGTNWLIQNSGTTNNLSSVYFTDANTGYAIGGYGIDGRSYGTIFKTTNGGATWILQTSYQSIKVSLYSVFFTDVNTGYVVGNGGTILKTVNGGKIWTALSSGTTTPLNSVFFTDANTGYAVGGNSGNFSSIILKTSNAGNTWTALSSGTNNTLYSVYFTDSNTGYAVGGKGTILKTTCGGGMNVNLTANPPVICSSGASAQINTQSTGGTTYSYTWASSPSGFSSSNQNISINPIANTTYYVTVSNNSGCSQTANTTISINNATAFSLASPTNGNYVSIQPTFSWNSSTGTVFYQLYIDGALKKDNISGTSYTLLSSEALTQGMHTWYVLANGCTQSNETWSIRVDATPPNIFNLTVPANNSWTANLLPTLTWSASSDANSGLAEYQLWIDGVLNRDNISSIATSTTPISNLSNGSHSWYIVAVDNVGNVRNSTQTWTIQIDNQSPASFIPVFDENFETGDFSKYSWQQGGNAQWTITSSTKNDGIYSAKSGSITNNQTSQISVTSNAASNSTISFYIKVSSESNFDYLYFYVNDVLWDYWSGEVNWSQVSYSISAGSNTFKWVYSKDVNNSSGSDCAWIDKIVIGSAPSNELKTPLNYQYLATTYPSFTWSSFYDAGIGFQKYQLFIDLDLVKDNISNTSWTVTNPLKYGQHMWNIKSFDTLGNYRSSSSYTFYVDNAKPNAFNLLTPANNEIVGIPTPNLSWQAATDSIDGSGISKYQLWINGIVNIDSIVTSKTSTAPKNALAQGIYTWFVRAYDVAGNYRQTNTQTFYVDWDPPTDFTLISPTDNYTSTSSRPTFIWHSSSDIGSGLTKYELNISGLSPIVIAKTDTTYTMSTDLLNGTYTWFVKAYDLAGSTTSSNTFNLNVNVPLPAKPATPTGVDSLCVNPANSIFTTTGANYATTYTWSISPSGAGTIIGTGLTATVDWNITFTGSAQITVKGHNPQGDGPVSDPISVYIRSLPLQAATPTGTTNLCIDAVNTNYSTTGATNATSYIWSISPSGAGTITGTGQTGTVDWSSTYTGTATITVIGHNKCGDGAVSNGLSVTINPKPSKVAKPTGTASLCMNSANTVYTTTGATNTTSYTWNITPSGAGTLTPDVTQKNATIDWNNTYTGTAKISVQGHNSCGDGLTSDTLIITVNPLPTANALSSALAICKGSSVTLSANASAGSSPYTYTWSTGVAPSSSSTPSAIITTNSTYSVTVMDNKGCIATSSVSVGMNALPSVTAGGGIICNGNSTNLSAGGTSTYTWSSGLGNGTPKTVNPTTSTTYTVTGTDNNGCTNTANAIVIVNPLPTANAQSSAASVCNGSSATLNANAGAGTSPYTYAWTTGAIPANIASPSAIITSNATYIVTITDKNNCTVTSSVTIAMNPLPIANAQSSDAVVCKGSSVTLSANASVGSSPYTYTWSTGAVPSNSSTPSVVITTNTTYSVSVTDNKGCTATSSVSVGMNALPTVTAGGGTICKGNSTNIKAGGANTYTWSNELGNGISQTVNPTTSTTYTVTGTDNNGCTNTANAIVIVNPLPTANAQSSAASVCNGSSATLNANAGAGTSPYTYAWTTGAIPANIASPSAIITSNATYIVTITDKNNCTVTSSVTIAMNPLPIANAQSSDAVVCKGSSVTLSANASVGSSPYTYTWSTGAVPSNSSTPSVVITTNTTYSVSVTDNKGCTATSSVSVGMNALPTVTAGGGTICKGNSTNITAGGANTYTWSNGLGNSTPQTVNPTTSTTYTVTGIDNNGCTNTANAIVIVNPLPTTPTITQNGKNLFSSVINGNQWYFKNVLIPNETNQSYTPKQNGNYFIIVTQNGCSSDTSNIFNVTNVGINELSNSEMNITIFPNPTNDKFTIQTDNLIEAYTLEILNTTGQVVLTKKISNSVEQVDLSGQAAGVYFVKLQLGNNSVVRKIIKQN